MIEQVNLANYKSYVNETIDFRPITILCGGNSSGKTSIIKSLLLLKQSFESKADNYLLLNGSYTNNGFFTNVKHNDLNGFSEPNMSLSFAFSLDSKDSSSSSFKDICRSIGMSKKRFTFSKFAFSTEFCFNEEKAFPQVAAVKSAKIKFDIIYSDGSRAEQAAITMTSVDAADQIYDIHLSNFPTPLYRREYPFEYINHTWDSCFCYFRGMQLVSLYKENMSKESTSALPVLYTIFRIVATEFEKLRYLGPLRESPLRQYLVQDVYSDIGTKGENAAQYLGQYLDTEVDAPLPNCTQPQRTDLQSAVSLWAKQLGVGSLNATPIEIPGAKVTQIMVGDQNIADVGFGVSQVFPILVEGLAMPVGSTLILEQPEIHLHPRMQMDVADFLIAIAKQGKHLIIETHSDHIINRMVRRAVEDQKLRDMIMIYFIERHNNSSKLTKVEIDDEIGIDKAPKGFFDQYSSESEKILDVGYLNIIKRKNSK